MTDTATAAEPRVWKRTETGKPTLSWCITARNAEATIEAMFLSLRQRSPQAEIVVVDTCSSDGTLEIARRYADVVEVYRGPRGEWDEAMPAVDNMAAARQRSFEIASGRWRAWADADDRVVGGEEATRLLKLNSRFRPVQSVEKVYRFEGEDDGLKEDEGESIGLEEFLRWLERNHPEFDFIWSPYLYRMDERPESAGAAITWQERERIVRWDDPAKFVWAEAAHEILVPVPGYTPNRFSMPQLLWVHQKKFTRDAIEYSVSRHGKILLEEYERGEITNRRCNYLASFAPALCPERELEFREAALETAWTTTDRYRTLLALGSYLYNRGLKQDATERFAAAISLLPGLPDAYYVWGEHAVESEDWIKAAEVLRKGVACELDASQSEINPREHFLSYPHMLVIALTGLAKILVQVGQHENAVAHYEEAWKVAERIRQRPELEYDPNEREEAEVLWRSARNNWLGQRAMVMIRELWTHLRHNDEPQKALALLGAVPWHGEQHPIAVALEQWARPIKKHMADPAAYDAFYNANLATGYIPMAHANLTYEACLPRVKWIVDRIVALARDARGRVLDLGCCDGSVGIPLLLRLQEFELADRVPYHGVDVNESALADFGKAMVALGVTAPAFLEQGKLPIEGGYAAIVAGEIVEHVPDPVAWLTELEERLEAGGTLLLTTPWGSFDMGWPPTETCHGTPRDDRGHLRAYSPWALVKDVRAAGLFVEELTHVGVSKDPTVADGPLSHQGMVLQARQSSAAAVQQLRPVAFYVAHALWDWNGSKVDREGIGASEELIVRMGEKLSATTRVVDVFGPVPEEEVYRRVGYWPQAALREVEPEATVVVSRSPGSCKVVDEITGRKHELVLWLQDTTYHDLNADVADRYKAIVTVSEWHRDLTIKAHKLRVDQDEKVVVAYNWFDPVQFAPGLSTRWKAPLVEKKRNRFIYASSPDRGLLKLLELWPQVLKIMPDAELSIFYGWKGASRLGGGADPAWNRRWLTFKREYERLRHQPGIKERGMVNHLTLAVEFQRASALLYPTDFTETGCLTACKAAAAGCIPVTSNLAALNETGRYDVLQGGWNLVSQVEPGKYLDGYDDAWLDAFQLAIDVTDDTRVALAEEAIKRFSWDAVRGTWEGLLT